MQVICKRTDGNAELHCCVCGQGFVLFWDRQSHAERAQLRREILETLRRQHRVSPGPGAHLEGGFLAPEWVAGSLSAAIPGAPPVWEL